MGIDDHQDAKRLTLSSVIFSLYRRSHRESFTEPIMLSYLRPATSIFHMFFILLSQGPVAGLCEYGNEPLCFNRRGIYCLVE
jgi:hypothetical protein